MNAEELQSIIGRPVIVHPTGRVEVRIFPKSQAYRNYEFKVDDDWNLHYNEIVAIMESEGYKWNEGKLTRKGANLIGRQAGVKNKATLFKQAMKEGFESLLEKEGKKVFLATVQRAIGRRARDEETGELLFDDNGNPLFEGGSDVAAKMILDRIVPVAEVEKTDLNKFNISINVTGMNPKIDVMEKEIEGELE